MRRILVLVLVLVVVLVAVIPGRTGAAEGPVWLPDVSTHFQMSRYAPTETDLHWSGWVGGHVGIVRWGGVTGSVSGHIETIVGDTRRFFDATQVNYHLSGSLRKPFGDLVLEGLFHHVSRHAVDREKVRAVDWNMLSLRGMRQFREGLPFPLRAELGLGHTTQESLVGYGWEFTAGLRGSVLERPWGGAYLDLRLRAVTVGSSPLDRSGFADFLAEGGLRLARESRLADIYLAFERRNDVLLLVPGARSRLLIGLRLASSPRGAAERPWP